MTYVLQRMFFYLQQSQFFGHLPEYFFFTLEKTVFKPFVRGTSRFKGIFYNRGQSGISHCITSRPSAIKTMGQQAKSIGISFKMT